MAPPLPISHRKPDLFAVISFWISLLVALILFVYADAGKWVLIAAWSAVGITLAFLARIFWQQVKWVQWKRAFVILPCFLLFAALCFLNVRDKFRHSFAFIVPGIWLTDGRWDFIVNHRGPKTSYSAELLLVDEDRREYLAKTQSSLSPADVNSFQLLVPLGDVNPKGQGSIFAKQIIWRPFSPLNSRFTAIITWRDGRVNEDIRVANVAGKWFYRMRVSDEHGTSLLLCRDSGFPSTEPWPKCFPDFTEQAD